MVYEIDPILVDEIKVRRAAMTSEEREQICDQFLYDWRSMARCEPARPNLRPFYGLTVPDAASRLALLAAAPNFVDIDVRVQPSEK